MPKKILVSQRTKFWRLRNAGHSIKEASQRAGFSESYGKSLVRNGLGLASAGIRGERFRAGDGGIIKGGILTDPVAVLERADEAELSGRPKHRWELSPVALDCLEDFERFRARYLGSVSMPWHVEAAQMVLEHLDSEDNEWGVFNAPQGGGKTRLGHDICAWLTVRDRGLRGCLGSGTMRISEAMTGNLRNTLARTAPVSAGERWKLRGMARDAEATLAQDYGRFKPTMDGVKWTRPEFVVEQLWDKAEGAEEDEAVYRGAGMDKEATWAAFSYEAQVMSLRFDFGWWDDVHTSRQLRNPAVMVDLFDWWDTEAESRFDPGALCLLTMQRLGANDLSRHLLNKIDPAFEIDADQPDKAPRQYFHVKFKAHYDDRCLGEHTHTADATPYPEGCMLDPKRLGRSYMNVKRNAGTFEVVAQQEDVDPSSVLVRKTWVEGGIDPLDGASYAGCWDPERGLGQLPEWHGNAVRYITADPSPTKFWSVQDWLYVQPNEVDELTGWRHLIDHKRDRMQASELLDWSNDQQSWVGLLDEWVLRARDQGCPVSYVIVENNAAQRWIMQYEHFHRWQAARGISVIPHTTTVNKADPELGIEQTIPAAWRYGRVRLPGGSREGRMAAGQLVSEVTTYPNSITDDCVMAQWFGEFHLANLFGNVVGKNNEQPFYSDYPVGMFGAGRPPTHGERRIADMIRQAS